MHFETGRGFCGCVIRPSDFEMKEIYMTEKNKKNRIAELVFFHVNLYSIMTILLGILIDMGGHYLSVWLEPPLWLDLIGTMVVAIQFGPLAGAFTGTVSVFIVQLSSGGHVVYSAVGAVVGLVVGFLFPRKKHGDLFMLITVALLAGLIGASICVPFNFLYYEGTIGNRWGDAMNQMLQNSVRNTWMTNYISQLFIDLPDKVFSLLIASLIANLEQMAHAKYRNRRLKHPIAMILAIAIGASVFPTAELRAEEDQTINFDSDYVTTSFGTKEGLSSSEVNAVTQTRDGYIWVGTYSGLYRYDGVKFEEESLGSAISNVICLYEDSRGRFLVGSNNDGLCIFDRDINDYVSYGAFNELDSDSIRSICEDRDGNIYVGTSLSLSKISPSGEVTNYTSWKDYYFTESLVGLPDGSVLGVSNSGVLFRLKDDKIIEERLYDGDDGAYYWSVTCHENEILVGTNADTIDRYVIEGDKLEYRDRINVPNAVYVNQARYSEVHGGYFVCGENAIGFLDGETGRYTELSRSDRFGSVKDIYVDHQESIWFVSSKQGLIKYSQTPFRDVFSKAGLSPEVVNATLADGNLMYVGTDTGLRVIDMDKMERVTPSFQAELDKVRIRQIMKDSKGNLWFSTYSEKGLVCVSPGGKTTCFNEKTSGFLGTQCRTSLELSDGRILAASKSGLSYIRDGVVVKTLGVEDGLNNAIVLCMTEREDGSVLVGTDGDGVYILEDDKVVRHLETDDGLFTSVIMRIVKCDGGYIYVASNTLYYDNGSTIVNLIYFPYSNNYDVIVDDDGYLWVTSSAGIFKVRQDQLLNMEELAYELLNENWGLDTKLTANSWNCLDGEMLYVCCTDGIRRLNIHDYRNYSNDYELQLKSVDYGEKKIHQKDGKFVIPATAERINFNIAVNNTTLSNPMIHYFLEGTKDYGLVYPQSELVPLSFTDLPHGDYKLHIEVITSDGEVEKEKIVPVTKEAMMYEYLYFRLYMFFILLCLVLYVCWLFLTIHKKTTSIIGLQKEISTDPMTGLLNKAGAKKTLTQACAEETGTLMMIDLDSFKLVNDLYGHDMGDRILIRFSELIRNALRQEDVIGRIGGDEFIGFIKNSVAEEDVERVTRYLNRELTASAKEYMGEDMNIPLGTSIGAVRVPAEGRDFGELSKLADKALYVVKQNGKHGYSFYQKRGAAADTEEEQNDNNSFEQIKKIIGERNEGKGAYLVNFDKLQVIYKFMNRNDQVMKTTTGFLRFRLEGDDISDAVRDAFEDHLLVNLRKNDVLSRYSGSFYVLCVGRDNEVFEEIAKRLVAAWNEDPEHKGAEALYEFQMVGE